MTQETDKKEASIIPYSTNIISQATNYCDLMHLPKEAVSAVLRALDNHAKLNKIIAHQQALPLAERKKLVDTRNPIADEPMRMIDEFVEMHMIPYTAMTWIEGKPYPKADGLRYKLMAEPRVVKYVDTKPLEAPPLIDQNNMMVGYECTVEFFNGEKYHAVGWADLAELQTRRRGTNVSPGFMAMIAETRAKRRCTLAALGLPTGVAEEVTEGKEFEAAAKDVVVTPVTPMPSVPTNLGQLIAMAYTDLSYSVTDITGKLKMPLDKITDFGEAWKKLHEQEK